MSTRPLLKECLLLLNLYGVDPYKRNNFFSNIRFVLAVILVAAMCFNILLDLIFKWRGLNSMESVTMFTAFIQILTKLFILLINRKNLFNVMNKMNHFWPFNKYGTELQKEIENTYGFSTKVMKYVTILIMFEASIFCGLPILVRRLPLPMYYPTDLNQTPDYEIALGLQLFITMNAAIFIIGFDCLFISLIINITCELKIIKKGFKNIPINTEIKNDSDESLQELYEIIDHHNLILDCIKDVREIYSFWLLNIYFYNMIEMCVGMLSIIATGFPPSLQSLIQYGLVTIFYMIQLYFYCASGQYLISESESVSDIVYEIDWWIKTQPKFRKALVLVICRGNKMEKLTAGGMFALNLQSFTKVTRSALSFFTLVNALYKDI